MKPIAAISNFKVALPKYPVPQAECERWLNELRLRTKAMVSGTPQSDEDRRKDLRRFHRFAIQDDKIAMRYFECPDVLTDDAQRHHIYNIDRHGPDGAPLSLRSQFFAERAYEIVGEMFETETQPPNHLVHVSCTGYISPSAPQRVVSDKAWDTSVTHAYHMGCYAALPAIRIAQGAVATDRFHNRDTSSRVDVVHTEMCALHVNPSLITPEQIVVQSLFADGHIKYSVSAPDSVESGFQVLNIREKVIAQTGDQMTWIPESWGLRMTLGRAVPAIIQAEVGDFVKALVADSGLRLESVLSEGVFAVHPGGPKIIDAVQKTLELEPWQVEASKTILKTRGNMSSATLPHVWAMIADGKPKTGTPILSLAFGPGLTMFGAVFLAI